MATETNTNLTDQVREGTFDSDSEGLTEEPVLDLSSLTPKRANVRFDEKLYELAVMDDFGIEEQQALTRDGAEFDRLWNAEIELSDTDRQRMKVLLDRMFERVLRAPKAVKKKMNDGQRSQVVMAFTLAPLAAAAARAQAKAEAEDEEREQIEREKEHSTSAS